MYLYIIAVGKRYLVIHKG